MHNIYFFAVLMVYDNVTKQLHVVCRQDIKTNHKNKCKDEGGTYALMVMLSDISDLVVTRDCVSTGPPTPVGRERKEKH